MWNNDTFYEHLIFQSSEPQLQSDALFEQISKEIKNRPGVANKINAIFQWCITLGGKPVSEWSKYKLNSLHAG